MLIPTLFALVTSSFGIQSLGPAAQPQVSTKVAATKESITFDPKTCTTGSAGISTGTQGARLKVLGRRGDQCEFDYVTDGCGGCFAYYLVHVPVGSGIVRVEIVNGTIKTSFDLEKQAKLLRTTGPQVTVLVGNTGEYVTYQPSQRASEMTPAQGDRVRYRFRVYTSRAFKEVLTGAAFDTPVEVVVGSEKLWPWLATAAENMTIGERRNVQVPMKIAEGARDWLPKTFTESTIYLEVALVHLERAK